MIENIYLFEKKVLIMTQAVTCKKQDFCEIGSKQTKKQATFRHLIWYDAELNKTKKK